MTSARGVDGSASGLIGGHDNRGQSGAEPRPGEEQCLQLRSRCPTEKTRYRHLRDSPRQALQFLAHGLDARIERRLDADGNGGLHQRIPRFARAIVGALPKSMSRCWRRNSAYPGKEKAGSHIRWPGRRVEAQSRIAAAAEQPIQRREQLRHRGGGAGSIPGNRILGRTEPDTTV